MNSQELILYLSRQNKFEELEDTALQEQKMKPSKIKSSGGGSVNSDIALVESLDAGGNGVSQSSMSSSPLSMSDFSLKNLSAVSTSDTTSSSIANNVSLSSGGSASVALKSPISINFSSSGVSNIFQFGIVELTGTKGSFKNAYTIGKGSKERASANIDYMDREEKNEKVGELFNKFGEPLTKEEAKQTLENIKAERRLTLSPNPRLNLSDEDVKSIAIKTMSDYADATGKEFDYIAALHKNTDIRHVHILMTSEDGNGDGVKMYKDETFEVKKSFNENIQHVAEYNKELGIRNYNDKTDVPLAKQIANFIGAVPEAYAFNQNKYLAEKISKRYDLEFDKKGIGTDNEKLSKWFEKNEENYQKYFLSSDNKKAYLFDEYLKSSENLSDKYDLGFKEEFKTDVKEFKGWLEDKKDIFVAERIATDKGLNLSKDDIKLEENRFTKKDEYKLTKWFDKNLDHVKEWNKENIDKPSKEISSSAKKMIDKVDIAPDAKVLDNRQETLHFVRTMKSNPMQYANETRKELYGVLEHKRGHLYKDYKSEDIEYKDYKFHTDRLTGLKDRLGHFYDVTTLSLKKYDIETDFFDKKNSVIHLDGVKADSKLFNTIDKQRNQKNGSYIDRLKYAVKQSGNIAVSSLENIGVKREDTEDNFKVEKVPVNLENIDFNSTQEKVNLGEKDLNQWVSNNHTDFKYEEKLNKQELYDLYKKDESSDLDLDNKEESPTVEQEISKYKNLDYKEVYKEIENLEFANLNPDDNKEEFYKLFAVIGNAKESKDIDTLFKAYKLDSLSDKTQMVKDFSKALTVNTQEIKKDIWSDHSGEYLEEAQSDNILKYVIDDYKEQFIERFISEISTEYLLHISDKADLPKELAQNSIDEFDKILQDFKEEYFSNQEYQEKIEAIKEQLENGEFKTARETLESSNLDEIDTKILNNYYEQYIDLFTDNLEGVKEHIDNENDLNLKTYLLADYADKDMQQSLLVEAQEALQKGEFEKVEELLDSNELDSESKEELQQQYDLYKHQDEELDEDEMIEDEEEVTSDAKSDNKEIDDEIEVEEELER